MGLIDHKRGSQTNVLRGVKLTSERRALSLSTAVLAFSHLSGALNRGEGGEEGKRRVKMTGLVESVDLERI